MPKLWPFLNSTTVSAWRVAMAGSRNPLMVTALVKSSELTSGKTFNRMVLSSSMVPVNSSFTPKGLNCTETVVWPAAPVTTGYGNSPPARKRAGSPLAASRSGSARICRTFRCCKSRMVAPKLRSGRKIKMFSRSEIVSVVVAPVLCAPMVPVNLPWSPRLSVPNCCVVVVPMVFAAPVLSRLKPKAVNFVRSTWANRTFSSTCFCRCGWATWIEFTISFEKGTAIFPIWSATAVDDATPVRTTLPSSDSASTASPGNPRVIASRSKDTSTSANTSMIRDRLSSCHSTKILLPAAVVVTTTSLGAVVAVVTTAGLPTSTRWRRGSVRITTEWPTRMCRTWLPVFSAGAVCGAACSAGSFCGVEGASGICALAGPRRPTMVNVHSTSRQRVARWTCRMVSFVLFRLCRKFSGCYLPVHHRLYRVDLRKLHHCGDLLPVFRHRLNRLLCYPGQFSNINRADVRTGRVSAVTQHEMDGALVLRQRQLFRLFRGHQQRDYVYVFRLAVRVRVHFRSG